MGLKLYLSLHLKVKEQNVRLVSFVINKRLDIRSSEHRGCGALASVRALPCGLEPEEEGIVAERLELKEGIAVLNGIGYALYTGSKMSLDEFYSVADTALYEDKDRMKRDM